MAIIYPQNHSQHPGETLHEGLVVHKYSREERVMSDVYDICHYALVWDIEKGETFRVSLGCSLSIGAPSAVVDAPKDVRDAYEAYKALEEAKSRLYSANKRVRENREGSLKGWNEPKKDRVMKVVRGRKVPQGTVGRVFWLRDGRVGLALTEEKDESGKLKDVAWVNADYLENAEEYPGYTAHQAILHEEYVESVRKRAEAGEPGYQAHYEQLTASAS